MDFDLQPSLAGSLVTLRPLEAEDFEALYAVSSDPLLWQQHPENNRWQRDVFAGFFKGAMESGGALLAQNAKTGEVIGTSRYYGWNAVERTVAIGYSFISRACWGRGFNPDMKRLMLDHAFRWADMVFFHIGRDNIRSRTAIERIGATFVSEIMRHFPDGTPNPSVQYKIDRPSSVMKGAA